MAKQRRSRRDPDSVVSRVVELTGLPPWKVRLELGKVQNSAEDAWKAFSERKNDFSIFEVFLQLAQIWELFNLLPEIPRVEPYVSAMLRSWQGRGVHPRKQRKPLFDQSLFLWTGYFKGVAVANEFFEWLLSEIEEYSHYAQLDRVISDDLRPRVLSLWEQKIKDAAEGASRAREAEKIYRQAPKDTESEQIACARWQQLALLEAREAKSFADTVPILGNCPPEFAAWPIALETALRQVKKLADAMTLLSLAALPESQREAMVKKTIELAEKEDQLVYVFHAFEDRQQLISILSAELLDKEACGEKELSVIVRFLNPSDSLMAVVKRKLALHAISGWKTLADVRSLSAEVEGIAGVREAHYAKVEELWLKAIEEATEPKALGKLIQRSGHTLSPATAAAAIRKVATLLPPNVGDGL